MKFLLPLLVGLLLSSCRPSVPPVEPLLPEVRVDCENMCDTAKELGCEVGTPSPDGVTCVELCILTETSGFSTCHPACAALAKTCDELDQLSAEGCN